MPNTSIFLYLYKVWSFLVIHHYFYHESINAFYKIDIQFDILKYFDICSQIIRFIN